MGRAGRRGARPAPDYPFPPGMDWTFGPWTVGFGGHHGRRRARRGSLRESILVLLKEQPRNGYQVITALSERTSGAWQPSPGAVYPALQQLTDEGLITPVDLDGQKAFELTDAGREAAAAAPDEPWFDEIDQDVRAAWPTSEIKAVFTELAQLAKALRLVVTDATAEQLADIADDIAALKRKIYATLAEDPDE
jgi:DNA-binding PadR family transcriptional regulator